MQRRNSSSPCRYGVISSLSGSNRDYYIYRSLSAKAAKLGCEIIKRKPFKQKNDLTAPVSALTMLKINGVKLTDYQNDIGKLLACFAADDLSGAEKWLESHTSTVGK